MLGRVPSFSSGTRGKGAGGGAFALVLSLLLAGCAREPAPQGINDPDEQANRRVHAFNRAMDKAILRPAATTYGKIVPEPVEQGISNFATNLDAPGDVLNNLLQARPGKAAKNGARFVLNSTFGIAGLFDPATNLGLPAAPTDFGETLHVWGAKEGRYVEAPFIGPSTTRDFTGTLVDLVLNPVRLAVQPPESRVVAGAKVASTLGDRSRYSDTYDSILYESADSYAQARLLYLQNRRFALGQTGSAADGTGDDPNFEDPYAQ